MNTVVAFILGFLFCVFALVVSGIAYGIAENKKKKGGEEHVERRDS